MEGMLFVISGNIKHSHNENIKNIGKNLNVLADRRYNSTANVIVSNHLHMQGIKASCSAAVTRSYLKCVINVCENFHIVW
jgi:hypothetical protein